MRNRWSVVGKDQNQKHKPPPHVAKNHLTTSTRIWGLFMFMLILASCLPLRRLARAWWPSLLTENLHIFYLPELLAYLKENQSVKSCASRPIVALRGIHADARRRPQAAT